MRKERESRSVLAVFARAPVAGKAKTRLAQTIGDEGAAKLYRAMLGDVLAGAQSVAQQSADMEVVVFHTPPDAFSRQTDSLQPFWPGARQAQSEGDLGVKLFECFRHLREDGAQKVVVIGSDSPDLPISFLVQAFEKLNDHDLVFGPAQDGGFYLMGASDVVPLCLFEGVQWSCSSTLNDILTNLCSETFALLPRWGDVDDEDDLQPLRERLESGQSRAPQTHRVLDEWRKAPDCCELS